MELKNGESKNASKEITLYIKINNTEKYDESFFREINIKNIDKDKNKTFCYTLQTNHNDYFKPSKFICKDENDISLMFNDNYFQFNGTLYYFFHSDNANYLYEYFIVSNFSLNQNKLIQINFGLKKSLIEMIDIENIEEKDKYIFFQILKSDESTNITYKIFKKEEETFDKNNYYKINLIENINNVKNIEIKGKCFFQYSILNDIKNFTLPSNLSFNILNSNDSYIDLSYDEFLENETINYTFIIEKKDEKGYENLKTPFSVFNLLNNKNYSKEKNYHLFELSYKKENNKLYSTIQIPESIKNEYLSEYYLNIIAQEKDSKVYFTYIPLLWKINKVPELKNEKPIDFILRNNYQNLYLYTNTTIKQGEEGFFMIKLNITTNNSIPLSFSCLYYNSPNSIDKNILYRRNISNPKCVDFIFDDPSIIFIRYDFNTKNHTLVLMIYTNQKEIESNNLALKVYNINKPISLNNFNQSLSITNLSLPIIYKIDVKNFTRNQMSLISFVNKTNILKIFLGKVIGNGYKISKYFSTEIFGFDQSEGNSIDYQCFNFFFFNFNNSQNINNKEKINFELRYLNSSNYHVFFKNYSKNKNSENFLINCNGKTQYIIRYNYDKDSLNEYILYPRMLYGDGEIYYNNPSFISSIDELLNNTTNNIKNIPMETSYKYSFFKVFCKNNVYAYISQYIPNDNIDLTNGEFVFIYLSELTQSISYTTNFENANVKVELYSNISDDFLINNEIFKKDNKIQYFNISNNNNISISMKNNNVLKENILLSILIPLSDSKIINKTYKDDNMKEITQFSKDFYIINLKTPKSKSLLSHYRFTLIDLKKREFNIANINYNLEIANYPYIPSPLKISNIDEFVKNYNNKFILRIFTKEMNDENQNYFFIIRNINQEKINISVSHLNEYNPKNNELIRLYSEKEGEISLIHQSIFVKLKNLHFLNFQVIRCKNQINDFELYLTIKDKETKKYEFTNNDKVEDSFLVYNGYGEFDIYGAAIFKHSIFFYKNIQKEKSQNSFIDNFDITVQQNLNNIEIKIPIEPYAYSYYFTIFIAENNTENKKIFEDPCYLIDIVSFNKSVNFFHKTIFKITDYNIDEKEFIYNYNSDNQNNLIIRVLRNDSTIYGDLRFSNIFHHHNETTNYYLIIIISGIALIVIIIYIIYYYSKRKEKEKSEGKILIIKQINNEFSNRDDVNTSIL